MMLSRSRELRINMGSFEHQQLSAMVVVHDVDLFDEDKLASMTPAQIMTALRKFCDQYLTEILKPEIDEAARLSTAKDSMLFQPETPAPASTRRVRSTRRT